MWNDFFVNIIVWPLIIILGAALYLRFTRGE